MSIEVSGHGFPELALSPSYSGQFWVPGRQVLLESLFEKAAGSLERSPRLGPRAPESERTKRFLRHLLYGKKPQVYRAIYEIDERQRIVRVLTIVYDQK